MALNHGIQQDELKTARTFIRYVGMGVMPSHERADAALDVIDLLEATPEQHELSLVKKIAMGIRAGILADQSDCLQAAAELQRIMDAGEQPVPRQGVIDRG
jgi:hypothetical protein